MTAPTWTTDVWADALLAAALLTPDSPELPAPEVMLSDRLDEMTLHNGDFVIRLFANLVGFTKPMQFPDGEWEVSWRCRDGNWDYAYEAGSVCATARLRAEVMRVIGHA